MELNGAFSNPRVLLEIPKLAALSHKLLEKARLRRKSAVDRRRMPRTYVPIARTITQVLTLANEPMSVSDIHAAGEQMLNRKVPYGSVKDWLSDKNKTGRVTRTKHGSYVLVKPDRG